MSKKIEISTEFIKLDSFMKFAGMVITGGTAKEVINAGMVRVNGEVCTMRGKKLYKGDQIEFEGEIFEVSKCED